LSAGVYTWPVAQSWRVNPEKTRAELTDVREGRMTPQALRDRWTAQGRWSDTRELVNLYVGRARRDLDKAFGANSSERQDWNRVLETLLKRRD